MKTQVDTSDPPNSPGQSHLAAAGARGRDVGGGGKVGRPS